MFTVEELREYLSVDTDEISDDALEALEQRIVGIIEQKTGNYFGIEKEVTIVVPGTYTNELWLAQQFKEITLIRTRLSNSADLFVDVDGEGYRLDYARRLLRIDGMGWGSTNEVEITGIVGYGTEEEPGPFPDLVKQVVLGTMGHILDKRGQEGHLSMSSPSTSVKFAQLENVPFYTDLMNSDYNLAQSPV